MRNIGTTKENGRSSYILIAILWGLGQVTTHEYSQQTRLVPIDTDQRHVFSLKSDHPKLDEARNTPINPKTNGP